MKRLLSRLPLIALALAAFYWLPVNLALNVPAARHYLSQLAPDQFAIDWARGWSLYSLRLSVEGLAVDGQTPAEQWQLDAERAAVSISLLPLLRGEIRIHDLDLEHIDVRLRPRPTTAAKETQEQDSGGVDLSPFFPVIRHRDPNAIAEPVPEDATEANLVLEIDDVNLSGEHAFWIAHVRAKMPAELRGSLRLDTRTSELSLTGGAIDLMVESLRIADRTPVRETAALRGKVEIPPFRLSGTEGLEMLRVATLDAEIDLPVANLDFLALVIPGLEALELQGQGRLRGQAKLEAGELLRGTVLVVEAEALALSLGAVRFAGDGLLELRVDPEDEAAADLEVRFDRVVAEVSADDPDAPGRTLTLFRGDGLHAQLHAAETDPTTTSTATAVEDLVSEVELGLSIDIPSMRVDDLAVYNRLIPAEWELALLGGTGALSGHFDVTADAMTLALDLTSNDADMRYADYRAATDLELELHARVDDLHGPMLHLGGTRIKLSDATVGSNGSDSASPWQAALLVNGGTLALPQTPTDAELDVVPSIANQITTEGFGKVLSQANGNLSATLTVSQLDWVAALLDRPLDLSLQAAAKIDAEIRLQQGRLGTGSQFRMPPVSLSLALLKHRVDGRGQGRLKIEQGGRHPSLRLSVELDQGHIRRRDEPEPSIGDARLDAIVQVRQLGKRLREPSQVDILLHSAQVHDLAVYDGYLPEHAPISLIGGTAQLTADLTLTNQSAVGGLLLSTNDIQVELDKQVLIGDLQAELLIRDGDPDAMRFDLSGSSLRFDELRVHGTSRDAANPGWHARVQLEQTDLEWEKPMQLQMVADLSISDTRPFVAMLDNMSDTPGWIDKMLTAKDLAGHLQADVQGEHAIIKDAMLSSANVGVHAKGIASPDARETLLLLRWHNLSAAVALEKGAKHLNLFNAQRQFAGYRPGKTPLTASHRPTAERDTAQGPRQEQRAPATAVREGNEASRRRPANPFLNEDL